MPVSFWVLFSLCAVSCAACKYASKDMQKRKHIGELGVVGFAASILGIFII